MIAYYLHTVFTVFGCGLGRSRTFGPVTLQFSTQITAYQRREEMNLPVLVFSCPLGCTLHFTFFFQLPHISSIIAIYTYCKLSPLKTGRCGVLCTGPQNNVKILLTPEYTTNLCVSRCYILKEICASRVKARSMITV